MNTPKYTKKLFLILILFILIFSFFTSVQAESTISISLDLLAESAILIDGSSGKVLYDKNAEQKMYPASTTKILTAILTLEHCRLNDMVTVPYDAIRIIPAGYAVAALQARRRTHCWSTPKINDGSLCQ